MDAVRDQGPLGCPKASNLVSPACPSNGSSSEGVGEATDSDGQWHQEERSWTWGDRGRGWSVFLKSPERNPFGQAEFVDAVLERRVVLEGKPRSFSTSLRPGDHLAIMEAEAAYVSVACLLRGQAPPALSLVLLCALWSGHRAPCRACVGDGGCQAHGRSHTSPSL